MKKEKDKIQKKKNQNPQVIDNEESKFSIVRTKIKEMYKDDTTIRHNINKTTTTASSINSLTIDSARTNYYSLTSTLENQRKYSNELYTFYPVYSGLIDYFSNMYLWRYTYIPRMVKEKANQADFTEIYNLMGEVVDGISIETTFPIILTELFINGAIFLITTKNTSSKTISTLSLPQKYCRINAITQFGTYTFQFDFSYFEGLNLTSVELETIFNYYPKEMKTMYNAYLTDKQNLRWQVLDGKYAAAFQLNKNGFPTNLQSIFSILQYDQYLENELARNSQQLDKIIAHKMPTWENELVVGIDEMKELHSSIAGMISKNAHVKLATTFGDMELLSIGEDSSKENKTLANAYNAIYDNNGINHSLFNGESAESLKYGLQRDSSIVWKYIKQLISFYNISINNQFNFKEYQCDLTMLPITSYNENDKILLYKEGATLGVSKLEYIVSTGVKQVNLSSKIELEKYLKLDQLLPLSTSYTQNDNSKTNTDTEEDIKQTNKEVVEEKIETNEVQDDNNTK